LNISERMPRYIREIQLYFLGKNYLPIIKKRVGDANTAKLASKFSRKNFTNLIHTSFAFNSIIS